MKSLITSLLALVVAFVLSSCELTSKDGDWDPFKWEKHNYPTVKVDKFEYIHVPAEGGEYVLRCKNYQPWINSAKIGLVGIYSLNSFYREEGDNNYHHLSFLDNEATVDGHELRVVIGPNHSEYEINITIELEAGDAFANIYFRQDSSSDISSDKDN